MKNTSVTRALLHFGLFLTIGLGFTCSGNCAELHHANSLRLELKSVGSSKVELRLENDGDEPITVLAVFHTNYNMVDFAVTDAANNSIPHFGPVAKATLSTRNLVTLGIHKFVGVTMDLRDLQEFLDEKTGYKLSKGKYKVKAFYSVPEFFKDELKSRDIWTGKLISNEIVIEVEN